MKTKRIIFLSFISLTIIGSNENFMSIVPNVTQRKLEIFRPDITQDNLFDGGPNYIDNIDVKDITCRHDKYHDGSTHKTFGKISILEDSTQYDEKDEITFHSTWTLSDYYSPIKTKIYETYKFSKLVDIPIYTIITRKLNARESTTVKIQTTESLSQMTTTTTETASNYYAEKCDEYGFNTGIKLSIGKLNISDNFTYDANYKIGGSVSSKIISTKSSTTTFSALYEEIFELDNSDSSVPTYFAFNFRQKFEIYFTTAFSYVYTKETWNSGIFNLDVHHDYIFKNYKGVGTAFYLLPIETPYFEMSKYQDASSGHRKLIESDTNENIVYL